MLAIVRVFLGACVHWCGTRFVSWLCNDVLFSFQWLVCVFFYPFFILFHSYKFRGEEGAAQSDTTDNFSADERAFLISVDT